MARLLPLLLAALVVACVSPRAAPSGPDAPPADAATPGSGPVSDALNGAAALAAPAGPLSATLSLDRSLREAVIELSREGYVALFMWWPGSRAYLVHPDIGPMQRQRFDAGEHVLRTSLPRHPLAAQPGFIGPRYGGLPAYFALIVADRPLHIDSALVTGTRTGVRSLLGPQATTTALAREIITDPDATEWTVAYDVAWPAEGPGMVARPGERGWGGWGVVRCPGGVIVSAPPYMPIGMARCPRPRGMPNVAADPAVTAADPAARTAEGRSSAVRPRIRPDTPDQLRPARGPTKVRPGRVRPEGRTTSPPGGGS